MTPRLLVIVTLAEAGGAQTFATTLVADCGSATRSRSHRTGPDGALVDACAALDVPFHHVRHLVRDPHPYHDAAAVRELRSLARALAPDIVQINSSKAGVLPGWPSPGSAQADRVHGPRLGVLGPRRRLRHRVHDWPSAPSRRSATRSCASRTTT